MLSRVRGAETVPARIDGLSLHRTFDAVLLASHLVNAPDVAIRAAFLATCRRHAADDGCVIIQQHDPDWYASATQTQSTGAGFTFRLKDVSRPGPGLVAATVEYESEQGEVWTHSFTTAPLGEDMLVAELADSRPAARPLPDRQPYLGPRGPRPLAALAAERTAAGSRALRPCTLPVPWPPLTPPACGPRLRSSASRNLRFMSSMPSCACGPVSPGSAA